MGGSVSGISRYRRVRKLDSSFHCKPSRAFPPIRPRKPEIGWNGRSETSITIEFARQYPPHPFGQQIHHQPRPRLLVHNTKPARCRHSEAIALSRLTGPRTRHAPRSAGVLVGVAITQVVTDVFDGVGQHVMNPVEAGAGTGSQAFGEVELLKQVDDVDHAVKRVAVLIGADDRMPRNTWARGKGRSLLVPCHISLHDCRFGHPGLRKTVVSRLKFQRRELLNLRRPWRLYEHKRVFTCE